ncbi:hypothetical protein BV25DRAFT_1824151 [Artomyces pyxidatus]|uniref:Uncharacterized protein n=1 Tax=Artomyces pyxidatus TaxID=48021 RepID=A0ACB8T534_9AGAM|nr:hypothetical protein BV25DRAFT_1824151 [Artomyces pyxidatus]
MPDFELQYPLIQPAEGSFRLLELPPDLCKFVESSLDSYIPLNLTIKGGADDDAVLCTADKTYSIRSVVLSNSVLVVTPVSEEGDDSIDTRKIAIQESLHEILELVPTVPKLHRLGGLLRGMEWDDGHEDDEFDDDSQKIKRRRFTYEQARMELQASEQELVKALKDRHILVIDDALRPIPPPYLHTILELLLAHLASLTQQHDAASVTDLTRALEYEHEVDRRVVCQVMRWFGEIDESGDIWKMDVEAVVRQIGLGILRNYKEEPIAEDVFLKKWQDAVGDTFSEAVSISLLSGNCLVAPGPHYTYFPQAELPIDPAARFTDLFLTRSRWKADDIAPFLSDIAVDAKDRDKLLLKYARALTDKDGVWYTARTR